MRATGVPTLTRAPPATHARCQAERALLDAQLASDEGALGHIQARRSRSERRCAMFFTAFLLISR
jgi:hypothetical protein